MSPSQANTQERVFAARRQEQRQEAITAVSLRTKHHNQTSPPVWAQNHVILPPENICIGLFNTSCQLIKGIKASEQSAREANGGFESRHDETNQFLCAAENLPGTMELNRLIVVLAALINSTCLPETMSSLCLMCTSPPPTALCCVWRSDEHKRSSELRWRRKFGNLGLLKQNYPHGTTGSDYILL